MNRDIRAEPLPERGEARFRRVVDRRRHDGDCRRLAGESGASPLEGIVYGFARVGIQARADAGCDG